MQLLKLCWILQQDHAAKMESHKNKQHELIEQLKNQLEDLERYAYETGEAGLPSNLVVERQKIIIGNINSSKNLKIIISLQSLFHLRSNEK